MAVDGDSSYGSGLVYCFGGMGRQLESGSGRLNDLWVMRPAGYNAAGGGWTRLSGAAVVNANGDYRPLGSAGGWPGGRVEHAACAELPPPLRHFGCARRANPHRT